MKKFFFTFAMTILVGCLCIQCKSSHTESEPAKPTEQPKETNSQPDTTTENTDLETIVVNGKVNHLTQDGFIENVFDFNDPVAVYTGEIPVVVDCSADWCVWCKRLAPHLEALAAQYDGQIIFYEIDMDYASKLANAMEIEGLPTLLLIKPNSRAEKLEGYMEKSDLEKELKKAFF